MPDPTASIKSTADQSGHTPTLTRATAWRNVLLATVVAWVVIGLPDFGLLGGHLARTMADRQLMAAFYLTLGFLASGAIIIGLVHAWQRAHGETLADLGWRRPTTTAAMISGLMVTLLWTLLFYVIPGHLSFVAFPWQRFIMSPIGIVIATAEEILFRGFVMEQLRRAGVATWVQIVTSALACASYHGLLGTHFSLISVGASTVLFGVLACLYVVGRRSLTPSSTAHSLIHVLGEPTATKAIIAAIIRG